MPIYTGRNFPLFNREMYLSGRSLAFDIFKGRGRSLSEDDKTLIDYYYNERRGFRRQAYLRSRARYGQSAAALARGRGISREIEMGVNTEEALSAIQRGDLSIFRRWQSTVRARRRVAHARALRDKYGGFSGQLELFSQRKFRVAPNVDRAGNAPFTQSYSFIMPDEYAKPGPTARPYNQLGRQFSAPRFDQSYFSDITGANLRFEDYRELAPWAVSGRAEYRGTYRTRTGNIGATYTTRKYYGEQGQLLGEYEDLKSSATPLSSAEARAVKEAERTVRRENLKRGGSKPASNKARSQDYRYVSSYFTPEAYSDPYTMWSKQEDYAFRTGKFTGSEMAEEAFRDRAIKNRMRGIEKEFGYFYGDPRLDIELRFGLDVRGVNVVADIETIPTSRGYRPFNIALGRVDDLSAGRFSKHADVYMPFEMIYRDEILREQLKPRLADRDLNLLSKEGLKARFAADYQAAQKRMGVQQTVINRKLGAILSRYDELWGPGMDMLNVNAGEDIFAWWEQFRPMVKTLSVETTAPGQLPRLNIIGQNVTFDVPVVERTIRYARNKIEGILNPGEGKGPRVAGADRQRLVEIQKEMDAVYETIHGEFTSKRPGALRTDIRGYTSSKEWFAFLRTKTKPFIDIIHSPTASSAEKARARKERDVILARFKRMNMGGVSQEDAIEMLGVRGLPGFSHTGMTDIQGVLGIMRRMSEIPEFGEGIATEGSLIRNMASALSRRKEDVRIKLAERVNEAIEASGRGMLPIGAGRLRGTYISRMASRGKGRFLLDIATYAGKGFVPEELVSSGLWKKFQEILARPETDAERKFVMNELNEGFFTSPQRMDTMMKIYARGGGRHGVKRLIEATRKHTKTLANELVNPVDLMKAIDLEGKSPAEALAILQSQTIKNAKSAFAKSVVYIPSSFKEKDADRIISRAAGGLKPLEDLRKNVRAVIRHKVGITGTARTEAARLADLMADDMFIRMMFSTMKTGVGGAGEGISALVRGEPAAALAGRIGYEEGGLMRLGYHDMLDQVIKGAIAGDGSILSARQIEAFKTLYGELAQQGYTEFPWMSPTAREALDMLLPDHVFRFGLSLAAEQSASGELARVAGLGYMESLGREISEGAFRAGTKPKGIWAIGNALRAAGKDVEFFFNNNPEAEKLAGLLRSAQGSLTNKTLTTLMREANIAEPSERTILDLASGVSRVTGENYDLAKIGRDLKWSNILSYNAAEAIEGAEPLAERITDIRAFESIQEGLEKGIFATERSFAIQHLQFLLTDNESEKAVLKYTRSILGPKMGPVARRTREFLGSDAGLYFLEALASANEELIELGKIPQTKIDNIYRNRIVRTALEKIYRSPDTERLLGTETWSGLGIGEWTTVGTEGGEVKRTWQAYPPGQIIRQINAWEEAIVDIHGLSPEAARANRILDTSIIEQSIRDAGMRIERTVWSNVPGEWFGLSGQVAARTRAMPDYAFLGDEGVLLSEGRQVVGPKGQKIYVGRNAAGEMVPAVQLGVGERDFGFFKNMGVGDYFTQLSEDMRTITTSEFNTVMEDMNVRAAAQGAEYANESVLDMMRAARRRERGGTEELVEGMSQKSRVLKTIGEAMGKVPSHWKILAAGVAGAAAITMMRRDRPLTAEDSMAYGGFPGGNAYPMGAMPVGPVNTYYAPPAASGMRASISGVVGPDVNISNLQSLVGSMGFANINVNDNSSSISRRDIDQMISSRL